MKSKDQKGIYLILFGIWKEEIKDTDLVKGDDDIFKKFNQLISFYQNHIQNSSSKIAISLYKKVLHNINYMINDFIECRSHKILGFAQDLKKIDESLLFQFEKKFYHDLLQAYRGISRIKKIHSININEGKVVEIEEILDIKRTSGGTDLKQIQDLAPFELDEIEISNEEETLILNNKSEEHLEPPDWLFEENIDPQQNKAIMDIKKKNDIKETPKLIEKTPIKDTPPPSQTGTLIRKKKQTSLEYMQIRFVKSWEEIIGADLKIYGPFNEEDLVNMPKTNAKILIQDNIALKINIK